MSSASLTLPSMRKAIEYCSGRSLSNLSAALPVMCVQPEGPPPWRLVVQAIAEALPPAAPGGCHPSSRFAFSFEAPRPSVIQRSAPSPAARRRRRAGRRRRRRSPPAALQCRLRRSGRLVESIRDQTPAPLPRIGSWHQRLHERIRRARSRRSRRSAARCPRAAPRASPARGSVIASVSSAPSRALRRADQPPSSPGRPFERSSSRPNSARRTARPRQRSWQRADAPFPASTARRCAA